ncbi:hypothetical protein E2C01_076309 [Portunus trituberculatus]|uniref:Uncharacterized protein n=1 Tax=Portunus trituberculatus TaxID=210409 RepID=A0A5B7IIL1_PORTR|nr:hypothetical protein [Portunus trituberculatus]
MTNYIQASFHQTWPQDKQFRNESQRHPPSSLPPYLSISQAIKPPPNTPVTPLTLSYPSSERLSSPTTLLQHTQEEYV